ncbi:alpha/beta hydrolase [Desulfoluna sp.]|uniref:alpha/beta fold hydrolase n=1 Tax=Desulfoluna sp. TaxID=2045199 RepID=UPI002603CB1E|nr:alpha/beta hydrolase [Desulfoluna sp.]
MPYLNANGTRLHVQQLNPDCEKTIVLLHGLLVGSLAMWYFTAAPLLAKTHRVILYDMRGHGKSEKVRTGFDIPSMVGDLDAVIHHFQLKTLSLAGHSYGGLVALNYALSHPEKINKLGIVDAPLPPSDLAEMGVFLNRSPEEMIEALPSWLQGLILSGKRQARKLRASLEYLACESTLFSDLQKEPDIDDALLASLSVPALLLYGDHSSCRDAGQRLAGNIPDSTLVVLPGGHYLPVECSGEVNHQFLEFFCGSD